MRAQHEVGLTETDGAVDKAAGAISAFCGPWASVAPAPPRPRTRGQPMTSNKTCPSKLRCSLARADMQRNGPPNGAEGEAIERVVPRMRRRWDCEGYEALEVQGKAFRCIRPRYIQTKQQ